MTPTLRRPRARALRILPALAAVLGLTATTLAVTAAPANAFLLPTVTKVSTTAPASLVGQPVTVTADVGFPLLGGLVVSPTGKVTFTASNGGPSVPLGSATLGSAGCVLNLPILPPCRVTLTTSALPVGNVTITAKYAGDLLAQGSTGTAPFQVFATAGAPFAPVLVGTNQVGSIQFKWVSGFDGGSPITSYKLYRSTTPAGSYSMVAELLPTGDYQETTTPVGVTYYYKATAVNLIGESPFSNMTTNQSTAFGGPETFTSTLCAPAETCDSDTVFASSGDSTTAVSVHTSESAAAHTLTAAIGGTNLVGCDSAYAGFSATFHDTSTDAFKTVEADLTGADAEEMATIDGGPIGCLGLGTVWKTGPDPGDNAVWSPASGLWVGTPASCGLMGIYETAPDSDQYTEPCIDYSGGQNPDQEGDPWYFDMTFRLPPGDGKISGSR